LVFDEWGDEILGRERPSAPVAALPPFSPWLDAPVITVDLGREAPVLINEFGERYQLLPVPLAPEGLYGLRDRARLLTWTALLLVTLLLSWLFAKFLTRPILDLQSTLRQLAIGRLTTRVPTRTTQRQDELGQLARSLDDMTAQLEILISSRERLLRDISHELRSPLARMRLAATLLEHTNSDDHPVKREGIARIEREITKLDELIGKILDLSRLELDLAAETNVEDLLPWLERTLQDARFEAQQAGKDVMADWQCTDLIIRGNAQWSAAAVENVLRNAIRHTPTAGVVRMHAASRPEGICIEIFNPGSTIPEEQLAKIFEPFFRVDTDRARSSGGTGLGLTIAARIMQAHSGTIRVRNHPKSSQHPAGVQVELCWPRSTET
jgi:signal transduction histidine kinase